MKHDLVQFCHRVSEAGPESQRPVFELHFLAGLEADEMAMLEGMEIAQAKALIGQVQQRLRNVLRQATDQWLATR